MMGMTASDDRGRTGATGNDNCDNRINILIEK